MIITLSLLTMLACQKTDKAWVESINNPEIHTIDQKPTDYEQRSTEQQVWRDLLDDTSAYQKQELIIDEKNYYTIYTIKWAPGSIVQTGRQVKKILDQELPEIYRAKKSGYKFVWYYKEEENSIRELEQDERCPKDTKIYLKFTKE